MSDYEFDLAGRLLAEFGTAEMLSALRARIGDLGDDIIRPLGRRHDHEISSKANDTARKDLLFELLSSGRVLRGNFGGTMDPRICDFAAAALAERYPRTVEFDFDAAELSLGASPRGVMRQRLTL